MAEILDYEIERSAADESEVMRNFMRIYAEQNMSDVGESVTASEESDTEIELSMDVSDLSEDLEPFMFDSDFSHIEMDIVANLKENLVKIAEYASRKYNNQRLSYMIETKVLELDEIINRLSGDINE